MRCGFNKQYISFYLDGELTDEKARMVELHLAECAECRSVFNKIKEIKTALSGLEEVEVSSDYESGFQKLFAEKQQKLTYQDKKSLHQEVNSILKTSNIAKAVVPAVILITAVFLFLRFMPGEYPSVITARGTVQEYNFESGKWQNVESGYKIKKGSFIKTAKNSIMDFELDGIYKVRLKPESVFKANDIFRSNQEGLTLFELKKGNMIVKIDKHLENSRFQVKTSCGTAEARGTAFSVDASSLNSILLAVVEGKVMMKTSQKEFLVKKDQKAVIDSSGYSKGPVPLARSKDEILKEVKQIGGIFIVLDISNSSDRTRELLEPARFYAFGKYPEEVSKILDNVLELVFKAEKTQNIKYHLQAIKQLEKIAFEYPSGRYNPQLLLFTGAYYGHIGMDKEAVRIFKQVAEKYSKTEWGQIAVLAEAVIYDEKIKDKLKAEELYQKILDIYPATLEGEYVRQNITFTRYPNSSGN